MNIFDKTGASVADVPGSKTIITLQSDATTIIMQAPITGVKISQSADYSLTKSLANDFLITAFGDQPVHITLRGLSIVTCKDTAVTNKKQQASGQILKFYEDNKISANPEKRIDVGIAGLGDGSKAFRCALISMTIDTAAIDVQPSPGYGYTLELVGIRK